MAHQTEIVVNGVVTEVTEFDHTAQEIDDSVDRAMLSLLAVAAAAAYNPSGTYVIGDYCTNDGNLYKCNTPIESGEAWNAAHWTATTVAAELAEVRASLSNRLRRYTSFEDLGLAEATATVASIVTAMGDNSMFAVACATDGKTAGWLPESYGFLRIHKVNNYYAMAEYQVVWPNAELWRGYYNAGDDGLKWSGWQPISTATKPQEFDLPRASGWNNYSGMRSRHWKNQFDEVSVVVDISNDNTVSHGAVVATLPEGFRPAAAFNAPAIIYDGSEILPVRAYFSTNGQISISGYSNQTWSKVLFFETQASFVVPS